MLRGRRLRCLVTFILLLGAARTSPAPAQVCVGDCNSDGTVTINELIVGVTIALGTAPQTQCPSFDADKSGTVTVNELIAAVNSALNGCTQPSGGVHLSGDPSAPAVDATVDMPPSAVDQNEIMDGVIMTRLDLHLAPNATVGQGNAALELINGGIVSMMRGFPTLTIAIPRPTDLDALAAVVQILRAAPGISWTDTAHVAKANMLPPSPAGNDLNQLAHLLPAGFPAAWNASHRATKDCSSRKVRVLIPDFFLPFPLTGAYVDFFNEIPATNFALFGVTGPSPSGETHGYDVTTTLAAAFNATNPTGANPFADCLDIDAIQIDGLTTFQIYQRMVLSFPSGKFLVNCSWGYTDKMSQTLIDACTANGCTAAQVGSQIGGLPLTRAYDAADWVQLTASRRDDFLLSIAAGNDANKPSAAIYLGLGIAALNEGISVATQLPNDTFLSDTFLWRQPPSNAGFPTLTASSADIATFRGYLAAFGIDTAAPADNALIVGSTKAGRSFDTLVESDFSDSASTVSGADGPALFAVGEGVFKLGGFTQGTSFAAPQVAGLASYLWLLSNDLRNQPVSATRRAIEANVRGVGVIDAYASALSLDAASLPSAASAPVRVAILDVNDDGVFTESDLDTLLGKVVDSPTQDYSRFDLNGDGFTGGPTTERFDLDRVGSTQFGTALYSTVMQSVEGTMMSFDENQVTDLDILCYYAYSALYTGDPDARRRLAGGHCSVAVSVDPAVVTLAPGGTQQFAATVRGTNDPRVTWAVVTGDGSISQTGLFTAGQTAGAVTVRASSVADPHAFGEATVTIGSQNPGQLTLHWHEDFPGVGSEDTKISASVTLTKTANDSVFVCQAAGTGTFTSDAPCAGSPPCTACTRPPEVTMGNITGCSFSLGGPLQAFLSLQVSGTATHTFCSDPTMTRPFSGSLLNGLFEGTPVLSSGSLTAVDFNRTVMDGAETTVTTGVIQFGP